MKKLLQADEENLKILFAHTRHVFKNKEFNFWKKECEKSYFDYLKGRKNPKTFNEWVNGQILAIT